MAENISQRCLKVGEEIRRVLSKITQTQGFYDPNLMGLSLTISEVRVSPDLKQAIVFVMPLGGVEKHKELLIALKNEAPRLRYELGKNIRTRNTPQLRFQIDTSFDQYDALTKALSQ